MRNGCKMVSYNFHIGVDSPQQRMFHPDQLAWGTGTHHRSSGAGKLQTVPT